MVKTWQQNWKQKVEEMSNSRVTKKIEKFQEGTREEDPGRDGAVTLIDSTLSNIKNNIKHVAI